MSVDQKTESQDTLLGPSQIEAAPKDRKILAILLGNGFAAIATIYMAAIKALQMSGVGFMEVVMMRYLMGGTLSWFTLKYCGKSFISDLDTSERKRDILIRSFIGVFAVSLVTIVVELIPLSIISIILNTSGFWSSIFGYFKFGDSLHTKEILGIIIGYIGLAMIIFGNPTKEQGVDQSASFYLGILLGLASSIFIAWTQVLTRKMRGVHFSVIQFNYYFIGLVVTLIALLVELIFIGDLSTFNYSTKQWAWLAIFSLINGIGVLMYTAAFQMERAGAVSMVLYIQVLYNFVIDVAVFNYSFTFVQIAGALVILSINVYIGALKLQKKL